MEQGTTDTAYGFLRSLYFEQHSHARHVCDAVAELECFTLDALTSKVTERVMLAEQQMKLRADRSRIPPFQPGDAYAILGSLLSAPGLISPNSDGSYAATRQYKEFYRAIARDFASLGWK